MSYPVRQLIAVRLTTVAELQAVVPSDCSDSVTLWTFSNGGFDTDAHTIHTAPVGATSFDVTLSDGTVCEVPVTTIKDVVF